MGQCVGGFCPLCLPVCLSVCLSFCLVDSQPCGRGGGGVRGGGPLWVFQCVSACIFFFFFFFLWCVRVSVDLSAAVHHKNGETSVDLQCVVTKPNVSGLNSV